MIEQVLALGLGIVAVTQEEFEKVKEAQKFKFLDSALGGGLIYSRGIREGLTCTNAKAASQRIRKK